MQTNVYKTSILTGSHKGFQISINKKCPNKQSNYQNKQLELRYKTDNNKLILLIRNAYRTYYESRFEIEKKNMKFTWGF